MFRAGNLWVILVVLTAVIVFSVAQDSPTVYTRVSQWQVDRAQWDEFVQLFEQHQKPVLDRLLDEGVIQEYGFDEASIHSDGGYTHSMWWVSTQLGNLEKALIALEEAADQSNMSWADQMAAIAGAVKRHEDSLLSSVQYKMKPGNHSGGYFLGTAMVVKEGQNTRFNEFYGSFWGEIYEQLIDEGHVVGYGLDQEWLHTAPLNTRFGWVVVTGPDGLTRLEEAVNAKMSGMDPTSAAGMRSIMMQVSERDHRDWMSRLLHQRVK